MRRVAYFFKRLKIHKKILLLYGMCILPVLGALCVMDVWIMGKAVMNTLNMSVRNNSDVIINQIAGKTNNMKNCANITLMYLNELEFLRSGSSQEPAPLTRHNQILKKMTYASQVFRDVDGMIFVDRENNVYGINPQIEELWKENDYGHLLETMKEHGGEAVWFPMNRENSIAERQDGFTLTLGKNIVDISTGERLGMLFLVLEEDSLKELYSSLRLSEGAYYVMISEEGIVVSSPEEKEIGKTYTVRAAWKEASRSAGYLNGGQYLYAHGLKEIPYYLLFHAPVMELTRDIRILIFWIAGIGLICLMLASVIAVSLARRITKPIHALADAMDRVSRGDLLIRCCNDSQDETRLIADGFNHMLDTIEELIRNIGEEQKKKRRYELALIQSQIKPHFLYNTLDTIYVLVHLNRSEDAKLTTKALADFYRVALSSGREIITMEEEIKSLGAYLRIQKIRYGEEFDYQIDVPDELTGVMIPKMTLQPLVENAIYHGLREKQEEGLLSVRASAEDTKIIIVVRDNGVGMDAESCENVLKEESADSYGLKNVDNRIRLYYGNEYGLHIESKKGQGTAVYVRIPHGIDEMGGEDYV